MRVYRSRMGVLLRAICITLGAHVFFVGAIAMVGWSLALDVPWYAYFVYVPLIYIAGAVPITPGGVGLVEGLYQAFFAATLGCPASKVLALALLARLIPMFWGLPGAVVAVTGPKLPKEQDMEAELGLGGDDEA